MATMQAAPTWQGAIASLPPSHPAKYPLKRARAVALICGFCLCTAMASPVPVHASGYDFEFGDLPQLPPEHSIIGTGVFPEVDPASPDYVVISSTLEDWPDPTLDCNKNGVGDTEDIEACTGESWCSDTNGNRVPDSCEIVDGANLVENGDFSDVNRGFSTDYQFHPNDLGPQGVYDILMDPSIAHGCAASYGDHTSGSGRMLAVNGMSGCVWQQTMDIEPYHDYEFEMWVSSWHPDSPAKLRIELVTEGRVEYTATQNAPGQTATWSRKSFRWNSGANTSVSLRILDEVSDAQGNDFAIDDISLRAVTSECGSSKRPMRTLALAGKQIVLEAGDEFLYDTYFDGETTDIMALSIFAETLIIRSPVYIPGADVTIHARELRLEGESAQLITAPTQTGSGYASDDSCRYVAQDAGSVALHVEVLHSSTATTPCLIMTGQDGFPLPNAPDQFAPPGNGGDLASTVPVHGLVASYGGLPHTLDPDQSRLGTEGEVVALAAEHSWFHPFALRMVLAHAKDVYYHGDLVQAEDILSEYDGLIATLQESTEWSDYSSDEQADFVQARDEIQALLYRVASNLDYYGNPAGWAPALSLEMEHQVFEQEIDRSFRILYASYCVSRALDSLEDKRTALEEVRDQARGELEEYKDAYVETVGRIPDLRVRSERISDRIDHLQQELQDLERELAARAEDKFRKPEKEWWRKALKGAGALCKVIPVGQPALTYVGSGADIVAEVDFDDPWSSLEDLAGLSGKFNEGTFEESAQSYRDFIDTVDLDNLQEDPVEYLKDLRELAGPIQQGIREFKKSLRGQGMPRNQVEAELQRLKATDPVFNRVVDNIGTLMEEKAAFAAELAAATQAMADLSGKITQNVLAIDSIGRNLAETRQHIDPRVGVYARDMEQRAKDRLRLYHYYFIKAYEYRMLEAYPGGDRDLVDVFEEFLKTVEGAEDLENGLTESQYKSLAGHYLDALATVAERVLDAYHSGRAVERQDVAYLTLHPDELSALNAGETVAVDLATRDLYFPGEEDIRITDIRVDDLSVVPSGPIGRRADLSVRFWHSGVSRLSRHGEVYLFRHYNEETDANSKSWEIKYDGIRDEVREIQPSLASESLLHAVLLEDPDTNDLMMYSRPAGLAEVLIRKQTHTDNGIGMRIDELVLEIAYDYKYAPQDVAILAVQALAEGSDEQLNPLVEVSREDINGRQNGMGQFQRSYVPGAYVTLVAPSEFGMWSFQGWSGGIGETPNSQPRGMRTRAVEYDLETSNTITVSVDSAMVLRAVYARADGSGIEDVPDSDPLPPPDEEPEGQQCAPGETLLDGECVPIDSDTWERPTGDTDNASEMDSNEEEVPGNAPDEEEPRVTPEGLTSGTACGAMGLLPILGASLGLMGLRLCRRSVAYTCELAAR